MRLLARASLRHSRRHPWQLVLSIAGVAVGVAVVIAVDLANESAGRAFDLSTEAVTGRATHQVVAAGGGIPEGVYASLRLRAGVRRSAPVVDGYAAVSGRPGYTLRILGLDPFAEAPFRGFLARGGGGAPDLAALLTTPGAGLLAASTAAQLGIVPGARFEIETGGRVREVVLSGLLEEAGAADARALGNLLVTDVSTAQELLAMEGRLSRIEVIAPEGAGGEPYLGRVRRALPAGLTVVPAATRSRSLEQMTAAFRLNLTAMSLLALVCGAFLIYNTMTFAVVQRRLSIGRLRALGVTRREVFTQVVVEALAIGVLGTAAGTVLGIALGSGLVRLVTRTINDLYFVLTVRELVLSAVPLVKGGLLGIGGTLLAALAPAREATTVPPLTVLSRSAAEARTRRMLPALSLLGLVLIALAAGLLAVPTRNLLVAFGALFALIVGCGLLTPAAVVAAMAVLGRPAGWLFGVLGRMAARSVVATLSRTGVAAAALSIAISVAVGVGLMIASFRAAVVEWLSQSLQADVYVTAPSLIENRSETPLDPVLVERVTAMEGVSAVRTIRGVEIETAEGPVRLVALSIGGESRGGFTFLSGDAERAWSAFDAGAVLISEPFAYRRELAVGQTITLRTDRGERAFEVAGIFRDYGSDQGAVMMSRAIYERFFDDRGVSGIGLFAAPGEDAGELVARVRALAPPGTRLLVQGNRALFDASLAIFDRTFLVTAVLRALAFIVAFIAVLSALMALQLERARELGVMRANGMTPAQVWQLVTAETSLLGLVSGLLSVPVGSVLAAIMVLVINRRSFGWSIALSIDPRQLVEAVAVALMAAVLAGLYPAFKMSRTSPALALREE